MSVKGGAFQLCHTYNVGSAWLSTQQSEFSEVVPFFVFLDGGGGLPRLQHLGGDGPSFLDHVENVASVAFSDHILVLRERHRLEGVSDFTPLIGVHFFK